jgi:hypothetical protein
MVAAATVEQQDDVMLAVTFPDPGWVFVRSEQ